MNSELLWFSVGCWGWAINWVYWINYFGSGWVDGLGYHDGLLLAYLYVIK
jgi:hypothetical protein